MVSPHIVFVVSLATILFSNALRVEPPEAVTLPTYTSNIQYEGIQFQKRARNDSDSITLDFKVIDSESSDAELSLTFNNISITIGNPKDRADVHVEKHFNSQGLLNGISLVILGRAVNSGVYALTVKSLSSSASAEARILSAPILPIYSKPKRVLQGDSLRISCRVSGFPLPEGVQWLFAPIAVELSDDKAAISDASANLKAINFSDETWNNANFTEEDGTPNDTLRFHSINVAQNGLFACNVSNSLGSDVTFLLVGVKDRWAALWPFIGIVVEVTVLVAAILLYERHQIRKNPPAPETTGNLDTTSPNGTAVDKNSKQDDVRLRNARA